MKNLMIKISTMLAMVAVFAMVFGVSSCKKDDETTPPTVIVLDGLYVKGSVTAYPDFNSKAMMKITYNENGQKLDSTLYELYIPIKAGAAGFTITKVAGSVKTSFGPATGFGTIAAGAGTTDEPKFAFQRGPVAANTAVFTVPVDGFYHVVFDTKYNKVAIMRVVWGLIGAATPGGWSNDTLMTQSAFNLTTMSYTLTGLTLGKGEWKFRYSHGWKVEIDTTDSDPTKWVKVNTNFGGAAGALKPGGDNIVNTVPGIYTVTMAYTLGSGYTATLTKTGNIPPINYSTYEMGLIGNAYNKPDGTPADWDVNFGTSLPTITGTDYVWTYTVDLIADKEFKIRQGTDWSGKSVGYGDVTWAGAAAANFSNNGGNIKVGVAGNYTLVFKIEAATETYTMTATKN
ncbi:MAG: SusF/SusE family outer membrane protein [Bacteroidales bacterium]